MDVDYIIMFVEIKNNGKWEKVKNKFVKNSRGLIFEYWDRPYFPNHGKIKEDFVCGILNGWNFDSIYDRKINPIANDRGLPVDASEEVKNIIGSKCCGRSYLTLKEIKDFNWEQKVSIISLITEEDFVGMKNDFIIPAFVNNIIFDIVGDNRIKVDPRTMIDIENGIIQRKNNKSYYVRVKSKEYTYKELASDFYESMCNLEKFIPKNGSSEDVRIVFGYPADTK